MNLIKHAVHRVSPQNKMSGDLKKELEKKRAKLDRLKRERELKAKELQDDIPKKPAAKSLEEQRAEVDVLVQGLIGPVAASQTGSRAPEKTPTKQDGSTDQGNVVEVTSKRQAKLIVDSLAPVSIRPKEINVYEKFTQTDTTMETMGGGEEEEIEEETSVVAEVKEPELKQEERQVEDQPCLPVELSEEEKQQILQSTDFGAFLERSSRMIEHAMAEPSGLFFELMMGDGEMASGPNVGSTVTQKLTLFDDRWSRGRVVTSMDWSDQHPELLLASYNRATEESSTDPNGLVLLWNSKLQKTTPEYILQAQSPVMCASFAKFHPSYITGGTYSGQVVLWDMRSNKRTPVQRSPLSSSTHTHPVYCLKVVGTQNAHNLITVSTDGRLCSWSLDMLSQPLERLELQGKATRNAAATCMDFPDNEVNKLLIGSEECDAYQAQRHGTKPGVSLFFQGHRGPISGISLNKAHGQPDMSHLFLTSSLDWTVKLWSMKLQSEQQIANNIGLPLCSFNTYADYVYDVKWSPKHPAVFASVDGSGRLQLWNLNNDYEEPTVTEQLDQSLNRVSFTPSGQYVAVGDEVGKITVFELGEELHTPHPDEWTRLQQLLMDISEQSQVDNVATKQEPAT